MSDLREAFEEWFEDKFDPDKELMLEDKDMCREAWQAAPQPDHSPDAGKVVQGKNRYGLDTGYFRRLIYREFGDLSNFRPDEFARVCARMAATADASVLQEKEFRRTPAGDGGEVEPVAGRVQTNPGARSAIYSFFESFEKAQVYSRHHENEVPAEPLYTHPAESREEIQAQALEAFEEKLLKAAYPLLKHWAVRLCQSEAARLRASQQEGGE